MIAIDKNVLVRLLIVDDARQSSAARALIEKQRVLILRAVLLETESVLRSRFRLGRKLIYEFFSGLAETTGIELEAEHATRRAIDAFGKGVDFADALHASGVAIEFHTFDRKLLRQRRRIAGANVVAVAARKVR